MKTNQKQTFISYIIASAICLLSCEENMMDWSVDDNIPGISVDEIPLKLSEKIERYEALKTYSGMRLGVGVSASLYGEIEAYTKLANDNFNDLTIGYAMKHGPMVQNDGSIDFSTVDKFLQLSKNAGLTLYGHTLVWHQNQNASYLNSLIAPTYETDNSGSNNTLSLSGLEDASLNGWGGNKGAGTTVEATGGLSGGQTLKMIASANSANYWDLQLISPDISINPDISYEISMWIRSDKAGSGRISFQNMDNNYPYADWFATGGSWTENFETTSEWKQIKIKIGPDGISDFTGATFKFQLDIGKQPEVTYYLDVATMQVADPENATGGAVVEIQKTDEEKAEIISEEMERWIKEMMERYSAEVHAWDVVNEPMNENGTLRNGDINQDNIASDEFYRQKYMGKDYAVKAFDFAHKYNTNPEAKMFINDYNLEYSTDKLDGLIGYVEYIESQGVQVDGIGTQMHLSNNSDKELIAKMFEKLAATGKLIKVSELDVRLGTASPTSDQLEEQMEMYKYVFDVYKEKIPEPQQYGITIWGISDNENEHEYWLPDESPNLWDAAYVRKAAYKGVADGLAGRDVSEDFTGKLEY